MEVGLVQRIDIEQKMRSAYLSYAMSVITARALPDVRDGLKPVQRRILYAMYDMGLRHSQPTRKSARIVGEVLGKYHPHGDEAVYDAMVRMAQDFTMRYVLVDGQGNFGSVDGDEAAAIRYTEARLSQIGEELLADLDKNTVDMTDNFDGSLQEPSVLPARLPNLLVNGVGGIAVGMATNIPPHNLGEVAEAIAYLIDQSHRLDDVTLDDLMRFIKGPDFPTGGMVLGAEGIRQAYATGRGRIIMRAQAHTEELSGGRMAIIVSELPYQVNKATLVERIATLVREGRVDGIADLRDESDRTGMRIVIELKRGVDETPILGALLKYTQLQNTFGVNMLALVDGEPRTLSLKRALLHYIDHRVQVIERRTRFELERALARAHILEGLLKALDNLDEVISTIRRSQTAETALRNLKSRFSFTEVQAQAILDMQLRRLAALERRKLEEEYKALMAHIDALRDLLAHREKILAVVREDALALKATYGDARRTRIVDDEGSGGLSAVDLQPDEQAVILLTGQGVVRRYAASLYAEKGEEILEALASRDETIQTIYQANSREMALLITHRGQVYGLPVHQLPDAAQQGQGLPLTNLIHSDEERAAACLHVETLSQGAYLMLATQQGRVKRVALEELASVGRTGTPVIGLSDGDTLKGALITHGGEEILLVSAEGKAIRFSEEEVRPQGLAATGMRGIALQSNDLIIAMDRVQQGADLMLVTHHGFAKRTALTEYSPQGRGGQGAWAIDPTKRELSGPLAAALVTPPEGQVVITTAAGATHRVNLNATPRLERGSWGRVVTRTRRGAILSLQEGDSVTGLVLIPHTETALPLNSDRFIPSAPVQDGALRSTKQETPKRRSRAANPAGDGPSVIAAPTAPDAKTRTKRAPASQPMPQQEGSPKAQAPKRRRADAVIQPDEPPQAAQKPAPEMPPRRRTRGGPSEQAQPDAVGQDDAQAEKTTPSATKRTRRTAVQRPPQRNRS